MRTYPTNSAQAAGRLLALATIADGGLAPRELNALRSTGMLDYLSLEEGQFKEVLHDLCSDLLVSTARGGVVQLDAELIDDLLLEIENSELRRVLLQAMWRIADADGWLADGEAVLLSRAARVWGAEHQFAAGGAGR